MFREAAIHLFFFFFFLETAKVVRVHDIDPTDKGLNLNITGEGNTHTYIYTHTGEKTSNMHSEGTVRNRNLSRWVRAES